MLFEILAVCTIDVYGIIFLENSLLIIISLLLNVNDIGKLDKTIKTTNISDTAIKSFKIFISLRQMLMSVAIINKITAVITIEIKSIFGENFRVISYLSKNIVPLTYQYNKNIFNKYNIYFNFIYLCFNFIKK